MPRGFRNSDGSKLGFQKGHATRTMVGERGPRWKGGRSMASDGYVYINSPLHPYKDARNYVREHRLVVEKLIGRYLLPHEEVHHLGKKNDNRPHQLMAFTNKGPHLRFERGIKIKQEEIIFDGRKYDK